jgi:hypothetical protein
MAVRMKLLCGADILAIGKISAIGRPEQEFA